MTQSELILQLVKMLLKEKDKGNQENADKNKREQD